MLDSEVVWDRVFVGQFNDPTDEVPRGSIYTTIRELGPEIPYYRRNYGSQFPNGCICGPSGVVAIFYHWLKIRSCGHSLKQSLVGVDLRHSGLFVTNENTGSGPPTPVLQLP